MDVKPQDDGAKQTTDHQTDGAVKAKRPPAEDGMKKKIDLQADGVGKTTSPQAEDGVKKKVDSKAGVVGKTSKPQAEDGLKKKVESRTDGEEKMPDKSVSAVRETDEISNSLGNLRLGSELGKTDFPRRTENKLKLTKSTSASSVKTSTQKSSPATDISFAKLSEQSNHQNSVKTTGDCGINTSEKKIMFKNVQMAGRRESTAIDLTSDDDGDDDESGNEEERSNSPCGDGSPHNRRGQFTGETMQSTKQQTNSQTHIKTNLPTNDGQSSSGVLTEVKSIQQNQTSSGLQAQNKPVLNPNSSRVPEPIVVHTSQTLGNEGLKLTSQDSIEQDIKIRDELMREMQKQKVLLSCRWVLKCKCAVVLYLWGF